MDEGDGVDFNRNEAITAVVDEGFLAEEDDDYEDLYNDVNVGEGFLQSLKKNEESSKVESVGAEDSRISGKVVEDAAAEKAVADYEDPGIRDENNQVVGASGGDGGRGGLRVELGRVLSKVSELEEDPSGINDGGDRGIGQTGHGGSGNVGNEGLVRQNMGGGIGSVNVVAGNGVGSAVSSVGIGGGNGTILFVGDLHWWTTDAQLEAELVKYGQVKEVKFFDEKASGKSKGYCQVEFYCPGAAVACKEGMNGHVFNGRPCVVAFATPFSVKRMGEAQANKNQQMAPATNPPARRGPNDVGGKPSGGNIQTGGNYQGGDNNRGGYGRGNWGRGNAQGMGNRGPGGPMRGRGGGMGGRGMMGNVGNGFGQGMGATPPMMHPQSMMGQGFDPAFGGPMGRMGNYGGFPGGPNPPLPGMMTFPPVGGVGLPGVSPHVNPAFFGRGMPMNGMGMMPSSGVDGPNMGMWSDPSMGGWGGEDPGAGRAGESSYNDEAASDHQYGEASHDRGGWPNAMKEKDKGPERDWSGSSDRRYRDDREAGYDRDVREKEVSRDQDWSDRRHRDDRDISKERSRDRDRERSRDRDRERDRDRDRDKYREERDRHSDHHRYKEREVDHDDDWDRGRSSRTRSKLRMSLEDDHRSRSRDADSGKRRRTSDFK